MAELCTSLWGALKPDFDSRLPAACCLPLQCLGAQWIHNHRHMGTYDAMARAMACRDDVDHATCASRARAGECESAPDMVGPGGLCRKTCRDCIDCAQGDLLCGRANMRGRLSKAGP